MMNSHIALTILLACILFVDAKVSNPPLGLQRRKHHGHRHVHHIRSEECSDEAATSPVTGTLPQRGGVTTPVNNGSPDNSGTTTPPTSKGTSSEHSSDGTTLTPPKGGFPPPASREGGIEVDDICFGFSTDSIDKGLIELNKLRHKYSKERDGIPRPDVYWNSDLALEAYKTASSCKWEHGNTSGLGQNMGSAGPERNVTDAIVMWWSEEQDFINTGPQGANSGHIGASLWKEVTAMGCGIADCSHTSAKYWITACNFNFNGNSKTYPAQPTPPHCPQAGIVVPYQQVD